MARKPTEGAGTITQLPSGGYRVRWYAITATGEMQCRISCTCLRSQGKAAPLKG